MARCWAAGSRGTRTPLSGIRDSSPLLFGRRGVRRHFPSLTGVRERSAERRYFSVCTLRCRVPCGHAAFRRSTCGVFHPGTVRMGPDTHPGQLSPALHPDRVQPSKAALHSKSGREPEATRTSCARDTGARAPRLLRQINASRWRPHVSRHGGNTGIKRSNKRNPNCAVRSLLMEAESSMDSKLSFNTACEDWMPRPIGERSDAVLRTAMAGHDRCASGCISAHRRHRPPTGPAFGRPDDRLRRAIQLSS